MNIPLATSRLSLLGVALVASTVLMTSAPAVLAQSSKAPTDSQLPPHVAGQILVKFAPSISASAKTKLLAQVGGKTTATFSTGWQLLQVASTVDALKKLQLSKEVAAVQPNYRSSVPRPIHETNSSRTTQSRSTQAGGPNDPQYSVQWALQKIGAPQAWKTTVGSNDIVVAVLDGGILTTHKDLAANIWTNPKEIPGNGKDDDKNGYIDDVHGWDANGMSGTIVPEDHGTHVAGIIGGVGNNRLGITGTNWRVKIVSVGYSDANGAGTSVHVLRGIEYILALRKHGVNVRAVNCSFGFNNLNGLPEADSYRSLSRAGVLIVRAAGNHNENLDLRPDAITGMKLPNLVSVGASDVSDAKAVFSTYGLKTVDIFAPGRGIISTIAASDTAFDNYSGTSMATPYVVGAAALLWAAQPNLSAGQVKARLLASATRVEKLRPYVAEGRRLNLAGLLSNSVHTIRGTVTSPVPNTTRYLHLGGVPIYLDKSTTPAAITDSKGNYVISGVAGGNHSVKAVKSGITFPAPTPVALPLDKAAIPSVFTVNIKALTEQKRLYIITGTAQRTAPDFGNTPLANVDIYLNDSRTPSARSDKDGKFTILRLTEGGYSVRAVDSATGEVAPDVKYVYLPYTPYSDSNGNVTMTFTFPVAADKQAPVLTPSNTPTARTYTLATAPKTFEGTVTDESEVDYVYAEMYRNNGVTYEMYNPTLRKWVNASDYVVYSTIYGKNQKNRKAFNWKFTFPKLEVGYTYGITVNAIDTWGNYTQAFGAEELYIEWDVVASSGTSNAKSSLGSSANGS